MYHLWYFNSCKCKCMKITISPGHSQIHSYYGRSIGNQYGLWNSTTTVQGHSKNTAHIKMILARDKGTRAWCHIQDLYFKSVFCFLWCQKSRKTQFLYNNLRATIRCLASIVFWSSFFLNLGKNSIT